MKKTNYILKMESINKRFPGVTALENVNFELAKGEICAICGENGAGKSTLIKILAGIYHKDSGKIFIKNKEINIDNPKVAEKNRIAFVHQDLNLVSSFNIAQSIFLGREPVRPFFGLVDWKILYKECSKILTYLNVPLNPKEEIKNLTVGEKQMVLIARGLSINAEIIVFDEPTSSLDKNAVETLFSIIKNLKNEDISIIYISHRLEEVFEIADRIVVLKDGKNVGDVLANETKPDELIYMMVGKKLEEQFPKKEAPIKDVILKVRNVIKKRVIRDINFDLYEGEILGIFGLVGSGRSELAETIFGICPYDSGSIYLKGEKLNIKSPSEAIEKGISLVPEEKRKQGLFPNISVKNNLTIANLDRCCQKAGIININKEKIDSETLVNQINIVTPNINHSVKFLSGGNQQKVILGKWLYTNSKIYIFDEPTKGIDVGAKKEIYKLIYALAKKGAGIIFISSEISEILGISDKVLIMRRGKIVAKAKTEEISADRILSYAILGRDINGYYQKTS